MSIAAMVPLADDWGMHGGDMGDGWWIAMIVFMVIFWAAVIVGGAWLLRNAFGREPRQRRETSVEILERRFAEGDLSVEDYRRRREALTHEAPAAGDSADVSDREPVGTRG